MTAAARDGLTIVPFERTEAVWDRFVEAAEGSTFCHHSGWLRIMADVLGHEPLYTVAVDSAGSWQGVLPLVRVRSRLFGDYLISMPFLNYGGPLGTQSAQACLARQAVEAAKRLGVDLLELRARRGMPSDLRITNRKVTVLLDLPSSPEKLWRERFPGKLRSQIRRPQKEGMEARFGAEQLEPFYEVFARNMRDLGTPVLPRELFERILEAFAGYADVGAVYFEGRPVAAGWGFVWRAEFEMTWASSLREHNRRAPNMLLYWSFMERMIERGVQVFNFGRCTPNGGTHRFKRQWGGVDAPLPWAQWSPGELEATPSPDRPLFRLATAAWGRLPLALANRIGPALARKLP